MGAPPSLHPSDEALRSYGKGTLDATASGAVRKHLERCPECRLKFGKLPSDTDPDRSGVARKGSDDANRAWTGAGGDSDPAAADSPAPPPVESLPPGLSAHPDYQIRCELGRGGMGVVYLAHNAMMGREEVLKVLNRNVMGNPRVLDRFQREIRSVARLVHPNIVTAYTAFRIEGGLVFAMEYVDGVDLARLVRKKGPLSVAQSAYFIYQTALGLQHAHEKGTVHRDIKPHNLMVARQSKTGLVKILDFGLAKAAREEKVEGELTSEGQTLGTPDYMAPEQILNAADVDIRADLYSLGGTLYYLLAGRPPFSANSLYDLYQAHVSREAEPLDVIRPEVPAGMASLVCRLMAKDPARRFQTPAEVASALTPFFASAAPKPTPVSLRAEQPVVGGPNPQTPAVPAAPDKGAPPPPVVPASSPAPEPSWDRLIEVRETDGSIAAVAAQPRSRSAAGSGAAPRWIWPLAAAGALLCLYMAYDRASRSREGTVALENLPAAAEIVADGKPYAAERPEGEGSGRARLSLPPGRHTILIRQNGAPVTDGVVNVEPSRETPFVVRPSPPPSSAPAPRRPPRDAVRVARNVSPSAPPPPGPDETVARGPVAGPSPEGPGPKEGGWAALLNGRDLAGWSAHDASGEADTAEHWTVRDGVLDGFGGPSRLSSLRGDYQDFLLRGEARIAEGDTAGLCLRAGARPGPGGYVVRLRGVPADASRTAPAVRRTPDPAPLPVPGDTWFTLEVEALGGRITARVDGALLAEQADAAQAYPRGHIAWVLDDSTHLELRRLEIRELRPAVAPPARPAEVALAPSGPVDIRRVRPRAGVLRLVEPGATLPILDFWPPLTPEDVGAWRIGSPESLKMIDKGLILDAGPAGNFLLTRRADYQKCTLSISLAASAKAEAYLALRANDGPGGWRAVTSPIREVRGKIVAGTQALDFAAEARGKSRDVAAPDQFFNVEFKIDGKNVSRVLIKGEETASDDLGKGGGIDSGGAVGIFLKTGRLVVRRIAVKE